MKKILITLNTLIILFALTGCSFLVNLGTLLTDEELNEYSIKLDVEKENYILNLVITNSTGDTVETNGTVDVLIEEAITETSLYEKQLTFTGETKVYIPLKDITESKSSSGKLTFTLNTTKLNETKEMEITNLPTSSDNYNTTVNHLGISLITYDETKNQFYYFFALQDVENTYTYGYGEVTIKIVDDNKITIYEKTIEYNELDFDFYNYETINNKLTCKVVIDKDLLNETEEETGVLYANINSDEYRLVDQKVITNIKNDNKTTIEGIAEQSSSNYAKEDIIDNNWGTPKSNTELNNMIDMYEELKDQIYGFMIGDTTYVSDKNVELEDNCFLIFDSSSYNLPQTYIYEVMNAVLYDNQIFYFVDKSTVTWDKNSDGYTDVLYMFVSEEYVSESVRDNYNQEIINYFIECTKLLKGVESDLEKTLLLHDKIVEAVDYNYSYNTHAFNIIGVMGEEGPVCESYSETYFMLLTYFEIPCYLVSGYAGENHAWNLIYVENNWYWVDVTWNDVGNNKYNYNYFAKGNTSFLRDRTVTTNGLEIKDGTTYYMIDLPTASSSNLDISEFR